jgi:LacI family transcriptional regulator/LacI family repressor for deo operon, udp, cdd, tsx, nupC, and nupG
VKSGARRSARRSPSGQATIKRVADRAGVSIATVSRVSANPEAVSDELRVRVQEAALALNYRPSRAARTLRGRTSQAVGVVIPDLENPFFTDVVRGIDLVLQEAGYTLLLANSDEDVARERTILETLRAEGVAGIIFVPINAARDAYRDVLAPPLHTVAVDRSPSNLRPDLVTVDNVEGTRTGVAHLLALGHTDVALLGGPSKHSTAKERERGYEDALRAAGRPLRPELVYYGDFRERGGYNGMKALMALPQRPTAVFVANNLMTLGAFRALHEAGVRIPEEIAVVGFDDMPWATSLNPPLTVASQPSQEIGSSAAELLLDRIARPDRAIRHLILETKLVVRASCGASLQRARAKASALYHAGKK